jgi:hypothetical protein
VSQPIYVVAQTKIADIEVMPAGDADPEWGYKTPKEIFRGIMSLPTRPGGLVDLSRVVNYLRSQWTSKMVGGANRGLMRLEEDIKKVAVKI